MTHRCWWLLWSVILLFTVAALPAVSAENVLSIKSSQAVRSRVDFWKLIFTKYGKNQVVFHFRDYPGVVYSVLDFSELEGQYGAERAKIVKADQIEAEESRIQGTLRHLGRGGSPRDAFERRVQRLFQEYGINARSKYEYAAQLEQIRHQTGIKELFRSGVQRSTRYLFAIERIFAQHGLPPELSRLPLVESSFNYEAYSSVGAAGIWQFMRGTGKQYLRIDHLIDERRDPIHATRAAVQYLSHAYGRLRAWPLAVTSYNHGITGVMRAVKQVGSSDLGDLIQRYDGSAWGFASKNFYCEFLAALEVEQNWKAYFPDLVRESPKYFEEVEFLRPVNYQVPRRLSGMGEEEFQDMNPHLLSPLIRGRFPIPSGTVIKVPAGRSKALIAGIAGARLYSTFGPEKRAVPLVREVERSGGRKVYSSKVLDVSSGTGLTYTVKAGDNAGSIAKRFSVSVSALLSANGLKDARKLKVGQKLRIPAKAVRSPRARPPVKKKSGRKVR